MRAATKVGIAVLLAVFAFVSVRYYLLGFGWRNQTYVVRVRFKDVRDLDEGSYVRMAGGSHRHSAAHRFGAHA